jgi:ubiquinone/menaquinone biosynthesis C-methylase UbiE
VRWWARLDAMEGYDSGQYGRSFADVYDHWYRDVSDIDATVHRVAVLAARRGGGRVLELGIGTGRLALPLAARGLHVTGVDSSPEMLDQLRAKAGSEQLDLVLGDMADLAVNGPFAAAFVAFNTFFNLTTQDAQQACLRRVHAVLAPGGWFMLEAFVPPADEDDASGVSARTVEIDRVVLTAARRDVATQTISGQHIEITEQGVRLRPWMVRYAAPAELDAMAAAAGLRLVERHADWHGAPFHDASDSHVSVYRRPPS